MPFSTPQQLARRAWLLRALAAAAASQSAARAATPAGEQPGAPDPIRRGRPLRFPQDHGAHPGARIEWWYLTGTLWPVGQTERAALGFQITFFRLNTGLAAAQRLPGRFAARQLLMAHAALTDVAGASHQHAQRLQRWSGEPPPPAWLAAPPAAAGASAPPPLSPARAWAARSDAAVQLGRWGLRREPSDTWATEVQAPDASGTRSSAWPTGFALSLRLVPTQPLLLQGDAGFSRKGPREHEASHYYSLPHLAASGQLWRGAAAGTPKPEAAQAVQGRVWLDHEWSDTLLPPEASGWDWIGIHLLDGGALTAFRLRAAAGQGAPAVWAGGSWRAFAQAPVRDFAPHEVRFEALAYWQSPRTGGRYPVRWRITTPAGVHELHALLDAQELDGAASTGTVYWEGLAELREPSSAAGPGRVLGRGYLEMTGYVGRLGVG